MNSESYRILAVSSAIIVGMFIYADQILSFDILEWVAMPMFILAVAIGLEGIGRYFEKKRLSQGARIPSGNYWKLILHEIYRHKPNSYGEGIGSDAGVSSDRHPLAVKLRIKGALLMHGISFLVEQKLIERKMQGKDKDWRSTLELTEKGFNVALKNEHLRNSYNFQKTLAAASILSGTVVLLTFLLSNVGKYSPDPANIFSLYALSFILLFLGGMALAILLTMLPILFRKY